MNVKITYQKVKSFFKKLFSKHFISLEVNKELATALDDKLLRHKIKQEIAIEQHNKVLNSYLYTFLKKKYSNPAEMQLAFDITNKEWKKYTSKINSSNKLINLNKEAFKIRATEVLTKTINNAEK